MNLILNTLTYLQRGFRRCYTLLIIEPLYSLYLESPSIGNLGGWSGSDESHICAQITNVPASHWEEVGIIECTNLINKRFNGTFNLLTSGFRLFVVFLFVSEMYALTRYSIYQYLCRDVLHDRLILNKNSKFG